MKLRWLLPAVLVILVLVGCAPDPVSPAGGSSPSSHPSEHAVPSESEPTTNNPYDY